MEVNLVAENKAGDILKEHHLLNVIPQLNKIIRYTGNLFTNIHESEHTFTIDIKDHGEWEEEDKIIEE